MSTSLGRSIRIILALSLGAATLTANSHPARAVEGRAIAAGVAGGVAGTIAGEAFSGALPPPGYHAPAYPPPAQRCWNHLQQERGAHSYHIGQVRVCD